MESLCIHCFADKELIAFISSQSKIGDCNVCGARDIHIIPIEELFDFHIELMAHFIPAARGVKLKSLIQENWNLYSSSSIAESVLNEILSIINTPFKHSNELVDFRDDILENVGYWERLKHQLVAESRYITDVNYLTDELGWDSFFNSRIEIARETELFRARLHSTSGEKPYAKDDMLCPPAALCSAGRANPLGIPYLYLSDNADTILHEIRAAYLDEVSIGTVMVKQRLNKPVLIADFTETPTIFHPSKIGDKIITTLLKDKISRDLSKPMRRYDSPLEYVPTQFICEFIKIYTGVDGIKFKSSLHESGNNFVIFDQGLMECVKVEQVKVKRLTISVL